MSNNAHEHTIRPLNYCRLLPCQMSQACATELPNFLWLIWMSIRSHKNIRKVFVHDNFALVRDLLLIMNGWSSANGRSADLQTSQRRWMRRNIRLLPITCKQPCPSINSRRIRLAAGSVASTDIKTPKLWWCACLPVCPLHAQLHVHHQRDNKCSDVASAEPIFTCM